MGIFDALGWEWLIGIFRAFPIVMRVPGYPQMDGYLMEHTMKMDDSHGGSPMTFGSTGQNAD